MVVGSWPTCKLGTIFIIFFALNYFVKGTTILLPFSRLKIRFRKFLKRIWCNIFFYKEPLYLLYLYCIIGTSLFLLPNKWQKAIQFKINVYFLASNQILIKDLKKYKSILTLSFKKDDFYFSRGIEYIDRSESESFIWILVTFFITKMYFINFFTKVSFE